jgi:hypothetical protein
MRVTAYLNDSKMSPNKITGANAAGRRRLPMQTRRAARVAQFWRSANRHTKAQGFLANWALYEPC